MRSRWAGAAALLLATTSFAVTPSAHAAERKSRKPPNIVFVMADDMRPDEMDAVTALRPDGGFAWIRDRATRTRLWYVDNLCCPSRTTILTGRTSYNTGVFSNDRYVELGRRTIPVWLQQAGYCTGFAGKYLNHYRSTRPRPPGWTYWEPIASALDDETGYTVVGRNGRTRAPGTFITDEITRVSVAQLDDCLDDETPTFLGVWPFAPHFGSDPAPQYAGVPVPWSNPDPSLNEPDITDKPAWLQEQYASPPSTARFASFFMKRVRTLLSVDDLIMRLVSEVEARGELDRTVFVLTSDNGYLLGEHRIDNRKDYAYEAAQGRFWIAGPGFDPSTSDVFLQNTDLAPTILAAARATARADAQRLDGVALQGLRRDPEHGHDRFLPLYVPVEGSDRSLRPKGEGVRTWRYTYVHYADGTEELYDLVTDPYELTNVAGDPAYADRRTELQALARRAKRCRGDACRRPAPRHLQG